MVKIVKVRLWIFNHIKKKNYRKRKNYRDSKKILVARKHSKFFGQLSYSA